MLFTQPQHITNIFNMRKNIILRDVQTIHQFEKIEKDVGTGTKTLKYLIENNRTLIAEIKQLRFENKKLLEKIKRK